MNAPKPETPPNSDPLLEQQTKLAGALAEARFLEEAALRPDLSPRQRVGYRALARSARAEAQLRQKAIEFLAENPASMSKTPEQTPDSTPMPASGTSINPETSG